MANDAYSDTFESTSIASTVDSESENATSLPSSSCNSFTSELQQPTGTITPAARVHKLLSAGGEEDASTSDVLDTDRGDEDDCPSSVAAKLFLNRKLEHLRFHTEEDCTGTVRDPARECVPESEIIEASHIVTDNEGREYSKAALRRLRCVHDERYKGENCSEMKGTSDGTSSIFPVRCERLKTEALKHRVKSQIKVHKCWGDNYVFVSQT